MTRIAPLISPDPSGSAPSDTGPLPSRHSGSDTPSDDRFPKGLARAASASRGARGRVATDVPAGKQVPGTPSRAPDVIASSSGPATGSPGARPASRASGGASGRPSSGGEQENAGDPDRIVPRGTHGLKKRLGRFLGESPEWRALKDQMKEAALAAQWQAFVQGAEDPSAAVQAALQPFVAA